MNSQGLTSHQYRVLRLQRNVVNGYDCGKREQRSGEAYTENYVVTGELHIPEAEFSIVKTRMQMATLWVERKPIQKNRIGEILEDLPVL